MAPPSREATAHHEAGHAVARFQLDLPISSVSIVPKGDALGQVLHRNLPGSVYAGVEFGSRLTPAQLQRIEHELVATLAGPEAERRFRGRRNSLGSRSDREWVAEWALSLHSPQTANAWIRYLDAWAADLMEARWENVQAVALALLERGRLRREGLVEILRPPLAR
jgi:hypothetical protein